MTSRNNEQPRPEMTRQALNASLIRGARSSRIDMVEKALELGADANASDAFGLTPMHLAATNNNVRMIQVLIRHGAAPFDVGVSGVSPFCAAVISGRLEAMRLLATHSLDLHTNRQIGKGALEMALVARKFDVAEWLIDHGADVNHIDERNESLLARMTRAEHAEAVYLLMGSGALVLQCAMRAAARMNDGDLYTRFSVTRDHQLTQIMASPGQLTQAQAQNQLDSIVAVEYSADDAWADLELHPEDARNPDFGANLKQRLNRLQKSAVANWDRLARAFASLPNYQSEKARQEATDHLFDAMRAGNTLRSKELLATSKIDIHAVDFRGLNLLQSWVSMTALVCSPVNGGAFGGRLSDDQAQCMDILKAIGSHIDQRDLLLARFVQTGNTVLHELIARGHGQLAIHALSVDAIRSLVNTANHDLSRPLHLAVKAQDPHLMSALVNAGANLNALDRAGFSPLHLSAFMLDQSCAETAIALGANIRLATRQGQTLDDILNQRRDQSEALRAILNARRAIDSAKSIFSSAHPLAGAIRHGSALPTSKAIKPFVPGFIPQTKRGGSTGGNASDQG